MNKKIMVIALVALILVGVRLGEAQQPASIPHIGFLSQAPPAAPLIEAFRQGLLDHGYGVAPICAME